MELFKKEPNPVGRPSNESLKKKRNQKILVGVLATVAVLLVGGTVLLIATGTDLASLMGNSVTNKVVTMCPAGYDLKNGKCSRTTAKEISASTKSVCSSGVLVDGYCAVKTSTEQLSVNTNESCPSNHNDKKTVIIKYNRSGQFTCNKITYRILKNKPESQYYCPANYKLSGSKCISTVDTVTTTANPAKLTWKDNVKIKATYKNYTSDGKVTYKISVNGGYSLTGSKPAYMSNVRYLVKIQNINGNNELSNYLLSPNETLEIKATKNRNITVTALPYIAHTDDKLNEITSGVKVNGSIRHFYATGIETIENFTLKQVVNTNTKPAS